MEKPLLRDKIESILPEAPHDINEELHGTREASIQKKEEWVLSSARAGEAELRQYRQARFKEIAENVDEQGGTPEKTAREVALELEKTLLGEPEGPKPGLPQPVSNKGDRVAFLESTRRGTTTGDIQRLFNALNINVDMQLSKKETRDMLACLLTCNESQLLAMKNNKKVPVAIKTIITRLLNDMETGSTATIEKLWTRLFGGSFEEAKQASGPAGADNSIIPAQAISREAYIVLRDTIIK